MKKNFTLLILCLIFVGMSSTILAQVVMNGNDSGGGSLREVIDNATGGEMITFDGSVSTVTLSSGDLNIDVDLTIDGGNTITIDANNTNRIFNITNGTVNLIGLTITNGTAVQGGGLYITNATVNMTDCILSNNDATGDDTSSGGGVYIDVGGLLDVDDSEFNGNSANRAGGAIEDNTGAGKALLISGCTFSGNDTGVTSASATPGNGGAIHVSGAGDVDLFNSILNSNLAASEGGAIWNGTGKFIVFRSDFDSNIASGDDADNGGGAAFNNGGNLQIIGPAAFTNNVADGSSGSGGAVFSNGGLCTIEGGSLSNNSSNRAGGAIELRFTNGGVMVVTNSTISNNSTGSSPGNGGAVHITGAAKFALNTTTVGGNSATSEGGGLWNGSGTMEIYGSTIVGNIASGDGSDQGGGGIYNQSGLLIVDNSSVISNNVADGTAGSGGGILNDATATLNVSNSEISGNTSSRAGGGIEDNSGAGLDVILTNVILNGNSTASSPGNGGGLHVTGTGSVNITGGTVNGNDAASEGGGLWNGGGTMNIDGTTINSNTASGDASDQGGGGIYNLSGTVNITNGTTISNNVADGAAGSGGGILNDSGATLNVSNSEISGNTAVRAGGGIEDNSGTGLSVVLNDVSLNGNSTGASPGNGGGLHITGAGDASITGGSVNSNTAASEGGGLWNGTGTMIVSMVTLDGNTASGASADEGGGAIFNNGGAVEIIQSTLSNNNTDGAAGAGGAIHNGASGTMLLLRSTVSGNSTLGAGGGLASVGTNVEVNASTIALNTAGTIGGGIGAVTNVSLENTIVAYNSAGTGNDVAGVLTSNGYNLIMDDDANAFAASGTDIEGQDPMAGPLQDNGGPTFTHELMDDSPAYNAGDPSDLFPDQRGEAVFDGIRDIGAFEAQANLSIADFSNVAVSNIYPNPTTGKFYVEVGNTISDKLKLNIINLTGQVVGDYDMFVGKNEIDISEMSTGIYILNISDGNNKISHKLIRQ